MAAGPLSAAFFAAAAIHLAIGAFVLFAAPRRPANWLAATFLTLLGGSALARGILAATGGIDAAGNLDAAATALVPFDLEWPASFLVLGLALLYPRERFPTRRGRSFLAAAGIAALALTVWVIVDKARFYELRSNSLEATWISLVIDDARYYVATTLALILFASAHLARPPGSPDRAAEHLLIAFAIGPLSALLTALLVVPTRMTEGDPGALGWSRATVTAVGSLAIASVYATTIGLTRRRGHPTRSLAVWGATAVAASGIPVAWTAFGWPSPGPWLLSSYGDVAYLLVRPVLIGYAILHHQLFDIDVRVKRGFATTIMIVVVAAVFVPTEETVRRLSGLPPDLALPIGIGAGFAVSLVLFARVQAFARGASDRLFTRVREDDTDYLLSRKRDVYRALLERAAHPEDADVARLRLSLGISPDQHEEILAQIQQETRHPEDPLAPGALLARRYRVLGVLGQGASGVAYRCEDTTLHREVAVKEIDLSGPAGRARRRALAEARRLAGIRHDHVVTLLDVRESRQTTLLIMELMAGGSVAARLAEGPLDPETARRITVETLRGLSSLHAAGIVHRDVKPSNVLLDATGRAKIADLGVAASAAADTMTGLSPGGTPLYMAPEQVLGLRVDARTDVYATAALLYEMLTGEAYARAAMRKGALVQEAIVSLPPPLPAPGIPGWANAFLARGLAKEPGARYASADEAAATLTADPGTGSASAPASARLPNAEPASHREEAGAS